ncbi:hypothetical protein [Flavobacterium kingsejongi]|uniref:hypothetical protein n=1 Tax=Flavobacterium kingsejongi TaxID=1678728 RepID=UPI0013001D78|nr:hypothetical protein [Flavobacterium kingsejongi]
MKLYLLILLCCFSFNSFAQTTIDSNYRPDFKMENVEFKSAGITPAGTIFKPKQPLLR